MASDLTWTKHVEEFHKANKVLGLLKRTVRNKNMKNFVQDPRSTDLGIR